jgi:tetrahydromethanopterin S-methyltransferase subunit C
MIQSLAELAAVGALTTLGLRTVAIGGLELEAGFVFVAVGFIAVAFMLGAIALQHPFNACLGPGETQDRTNMLVIECGFLSMIIMAVISFVAVSAVAGWISLIIAIIGWAVSYKKYIALSKRDAAAWLDAKPFVDAEEE